MIHSGAVIAAGISQGRSTTLGCDLKVTFGSLQYVNVSTDVCNVVREKHHSLLLLISVLNIHQFR